MQEYTISDLLSQSIRDFLRLQEQQSEKTVGKAFDLTTNSTIAFLFEF